MLGCRGIDPAKGPYPGILTERRSILVRSAVYQEGPKNPLKGISLKPLVPALNAQFGVGAGGKRIIALAFSGRSTMA